MLIALIKREMSTFWYQAPLIELIQGNCFQRRSCWPKTGEHLEFNVVYHDGTESRKVGSKYVVQKRLNADALQKTFWLSRVFQTSSVKYSNTTRCEQNLQWRVGASFDL